MNELKHIIEKHEDFIHLTNPQQELLHQVDKEKLVNFSHVIGSQIELSHQIDNMKFIYFSHLSKSGMVETIHGQLQNSRIIDTNGSYAIDLDYKYLLGYNTATIN